MLKVGCPFKEYLGSKPWTGVFMLGEEETLSLVSLPARFDWSIMGCTILLLALMNLEETERRKANVKSSLHSRTPRDSSQAATKTKQFCMT